MQYVRCHVKGKRLDALDVVVIRDASFQDVLTDEYLHCKTLMSIHVNAMVFQNTVWYIRFTFEIDRRVH
jgi:hypothetical protein